MMRLGRLFMLLLLFLPACQSKDKRVEVDPEFQLYVDRFVLAAKERGIPVDFSDTGLSIQFGNFKEGVAGNCSERGSMTEGDHTILINRSEWEDLSDSQKERIILHELGHCELGRIHDNQIYSNGDWKSIMRGEPLPQKSPLVNYTGRRLEYYLDELFTPRVSVPEWVRMFAEYSDISQEQKSEVLTIINPNLQNYNFSLPLNDNFEIELNLRKTSNDPNSFGGVRWGGEHLENSLYVALKGTSTFLISSGSALVGPIFLVDLPEGEANAQSKITIRKSNHVYYLFLNEKFLYWIDDILDIDSLVSPIKEENTKVEFNSLKVFAWD